MRPEIDITEAERTAIEQYAEREGYTMRRAYTQLIRNTLYLRVGVAYGVNDKPLLVIDTDGFGVAYPVSKTGADEYTRLVSAEHTEDLECSGLEYDYNHYFTEEDNE